MLRAAHHENEPVHSEAALDSQQQLTVSSFIPLEEDFHPKKDQTSVPSPEKYQGRREETNMVIINIKLLSGYILDKISLQMLGNDRSVKRVDVEEGFINIYLDGLKKDEGTSHAVTLEEDVPVRNLKPAVVKVYDYYQTSDSAATDYSSPCAEHDVVNEL